MALTSEDRIGTPGTAEVPTALSRHEGWLLSGAAIAAGAGLTYIVGSDGQTPWRLLRVLAVLAITATGCITLRAVGGARRSAIGFVAGLVAMPVGLGIALPFAGKAGLAAMTVAGSSTLVGGAVLVLAGGFGLARVMPRWWRVAVVPAMALALVTSCFVLAQAVAATNVPATTVGSSTPADRGLSYRDVEFTTKDGFRLSGWYVPSTNGAAVVMLHGAGSTRSAVLNHAVVLARYGYGVLLFDARGHGRSAGQAMDFGWYGDRDVSAAVSFLENQADVEDARIAAVGPSMGGEEAIGAADGDQRIQAVVAEGATNRVAADKAWLSDEYGWRGTVQEGAEWLEYGVVDLLTDAHPPISLRDAVAAAAPRPVLLIAGAAVEEESPADRFIRAGSPETVSLWVVPDTGHTDALSTHPLAWEHRVVDFLARAIGS